MFKVSPASLQTFVDTPNCVLEDRVQYSRSTFRMYYLMAIVRSQRLFDHPVLKLIM
jgi:hypothetical protein